MLIRGKLANTSVNKDSVSKTSFNMRLNENPDGFSQILKMSNHSQDASAIVRKDEERMVNVKFAHPDIFKTCLNANIKSNSEFCSQSMRNQQ